MTAPEPGRPPLVGRDRELDVLRHAVWAVEDHGSAIVVRGQAGVGKSTLLQATAELGRARGALVVEASGVQSEAMLPFAGLHQLLRPLLVHADALPSVQRRALFTALGAEDGPPPAIFLTALATLTLVVEAAVTQPVVLLVDDVHWLDTPTVEVLAFVSRRLRYDPVVLVAGLREDYPVSLDLAEIQDLHVRGLDSASSRALLTSVAADLTAADRRALLSHARGNPLALVELPTVWRSAGLDVLTAAASTVPLSTRLEQAFAARIHGLPDRTRDALLVAAVHADDSLHEVLAGATVLAEQAVTSEDLEPAVGANLLDFDETRVRFRHPLMRAGALHSEPLRRRQAAHAAMSAVLVDEPYRRVWHQAQSADGPDDAIAAELEASHVESMRRGSVLSAIAALERSAQLTRAPGVRARRLLVAAQHACGLGRADLVARLVRAAEAEDLDEAERARAEWLMELVGTSQLGNSARVRELCSLADRSASASDTDLALELLASAALRCWWAVGDPADRDRVVQVASTLTAMQDDPRCIAVTAIADPLRRIPQTRRRLEALTVAGVSDAEHLRQLGLAARAIGADDAAADYFAAAEAKLRERGQLGLLSHVLAVQAAVYLDLGDWARAGQSLEEGRQLSAETGQTTWRTGTAAVSAVHEALTGDTAAALRHAGEIERGCAGEQAGDFLSLISIARGVTSLAARQYPDALRVLSPVLDPSSRFHHPRQQLSALMLVVEAAAGCDALDEVRSLVDRMEDLADETTSPILDVHLLYVRPLLARSDDEAERLFHDALAHDLTRWPWPRARMQLAHGDWLRRRRRLAEARTPLRAALTTFATMGAPSWTASTRIALRACGERMATAGADAHGSSMTAQEMQIARLAAEGLSNREIGQQLYLSPRTVGSHLYRIFPKLGITSRAQLAAHVTPA